MAIGKRFIGAVFLMAALSACSSAAASVPGTGGATELRARDVFLTEGDGSAASFGSIRDGASGVSVGSGDQITLAP